VDIELESNVAVFSKLYKNNVHLYHLSPKHDTDNMFIIEVSPCKDYQLQYGILEYKGSEYVVETAKQISKYSDKGRYISVLPLQEQTAKNYYLKISTDESRLEEVMCKYKFDQMKDQTCKLDSEGGYDYWVKYISINSDYNKFNDIPNNGNKIYLTLII